MAARKSSYESLASLTNVGRGMLLILLILSLVIYFKHTGLSQLFTLETLNSQNAQASQLQEEAGVIAHTIATTPQGLPLINNNQALQNYVSSLADQTKRDIVVLDTNKKVLADAVEEEVGTVFSHDKGYEVNKTIEDGIPRTFEEKSKAYPSGINQTVVAIRDANGKVLGALILSSSTNLTR